MALAKEPCRRKAGHTAADNGNAFRSASGGGGRDEIAQDIAPVERVSAVMYGPSPGLDFVQINIFAASDPLPDAARISSMFDAVSPTAPLCHPVLGRSAHLTLRAATASKKMKVPVRATEPQTVDAEALSAMLVAVGTRQDRSAFGDLFRHFAPRLKSYLLRLGADAASAEETMQEAMVLVWRKAAQFDPARASASTWIFTIARNARIDAFRKDRRPELDPDDPALTPDPSEPPDASMEREQSAARLRQAVSGLSDAEQSVLQLAFFEDLSHAVIAKKLGLPLGTVKSRLRLAFGKLRNALPELGDVSE